MGRASALPASVPPFPQAAALSLLPMLVTLTPPVKLTPHRLSRRTVGRGAALPKAQITLPGGIGILLIPGSILLPHLPTHLSGQKCAMPQKNDNCI